MDKKILLSIIAIIAIVGIVIVSTSSNNDSITLNYHGFEFAIPEGFYSNSKISNETEFILENSQGNKIEVRIEKNVNMNTNSKPTTIILNNIEFNKYPNMQIPNSINYIEGEFVVTSFTNATIYNFRNINESFYILIEEGIANPDEVVKNMTAKNS